MANNKKKKENILKIGSDLTIDSISAIYIKFKEALVKESSLLVESAEIKNLDTTGIQFLHFAKDLGKTSQVALTLKLKFSPEATQLLLKTGFSYIMN